MKQTNWWRLLGFVIFTQLIGFSSAFLAGNTREIAMILKQPVLSPPSWVFPIVWPILYALMAIAAYLAYEKSQNSITLRYYGIQLFFNFIWSIVFFRWGMLWGSVMVIILLDISVLATMHLFNRYSKLAKNLMIPYLLWILFATYLNIQIALLNEKSFAIMRSFFL